MELLSKAKMSLHQEQETICITTTLKLGWETQHSKHSREFCCISRTPKNVTSTAAEPKQLSVMPQLQ